MTKTKEQQIASINALVDMMKQLKLPDDAGMADLTMLVAVSQSIANKCIDLHGYMAGVDVEKMKLLVRD